MWFVGSLVKLWGALPASGKGFISGTAVGVLLSVALWLGFPRHDPSDKIALQNANAALDSTRAIVARHDTLFARLLAQKDVEFSGAMGTVASLRRANAKLSAKLDITSAGVRATASHVVTGPRGQGSGSPAAGDAAGTIGAASGAASVADTLVLPDSGSVQGTVGVTVTAQPDTTLRFDWDARLRPSPIHLEVGLGCGKDGPELVANGPDWAHVEIQPSEVKPEVCNPAVRVGVVRKGLEVVGGVTVGALVAKGVIALVHLF